MKAYLYVLNTLADWEIGYLTAEMNSRRYFADKNADFQLITVGNTGDPITTMGGITIKPAARLDSIYIGKSDILILPGGDTWLDKENEPVLQLAKSRIEQGETVAAICGGTIGLASVGALNEKKHTSNNKEFLKMTCKNYSGDQLYGDKPVVRDGNLITATGLAPLEFSYEVLNILGVFSYSTLQAWYSLNKTRQAKYFYELMDSLKDQV
jgi:putative intracellular protease/amidase